VFFVASKVIMMSRATDPAAVAFQRWPTPDSRPISFAGVLPGLISLLIYGPDFAMWKVCGRYPLRNAGPKPRESFWRALLDDRAFE
jgi:hypothetical protein